MKTVYYNIIVYILLVLCSNSMLWDRMPTERKEIQTQKKVYRSQVSWTFAFWPRELRNGVCTSIGNTGHTYTN